VAGLAAMEKKIGRRFFGTVSFCMRKQYFKSVYAHKRGRYVMYAIAMEAQDMVYWTQQIRTGKG